MIKNPQTRIPSWNVPISHNEHACMYQIDLTDAFTKQDVSDLMANTSWAIRSTIDIVPEASQLAAIFGRAYNSIYPSLLIDIQLGKIGKAIDHNTAS